MYFPVEIADGARGIALARTAREKTDMRTWTTAALLAVMTPAVGTLASSRNTVAVQAELQSLYDEDSAAALQFFTPQDVDDFHSVFCTEDWFFLDTAGHRHAWSEMREQAAKQLTEPHALSIAQPINKVSLTRNGATAVVTVTTVRGITDDEGRYGKKGARHTLTESTKYRDSWVQVGNGWKQQSREQIGRSSQRPDEPENLDR